MWFLFILVFVSVGLLTYGIIATLTSKKLQIENRIDTYIKQDSAFQNPEVKKVLELPFHKRVLIPAWKDVKRIYKRRLGTDKTSKLEMKLLQAGQPFQLSPVDFQIVLLVLAVVFPIVGLVFGFLVNATSLVKIILTLLGFMIAIILPKNYLKSKAEKRAKLASKELPDILDLITISLEAGLGFDAALSQVVSKKNGVLSYEFKICLEEMRIGKTRKEALTGVSERVKSDELRSLIYNIIQAEKLGVGMVSVLRVQAEDIREWRKQTAEEAAMKAPIKMMFPLVLFIFPTLFIILLGPAVIQFMGSF